MHEEDVEIELQDDSVNDELENLEQDEQNTHDNADYKPSDDELGFSFDDEPTSDPEKDALRQEIRRLERIANRHISPNQTLRAKPTLLDYDYDDEAYEADLEKWYAEKVDFDNSQKAEKEKYQVFDDNYIKSVNQMRKIAEDYDEVELTVADSLDEPKQALLKMAVEDSARMAYFLGKSPKKLDELAKADPISFVKQLGVLEEQMTKRRNLNKPLPKDHELTGRAGGGDSQLAKLEAEAERTGDRSKLIAYKRAKAK